MTASHLRLLPERTRSDAARTKPKPSRIAQKSSVRNQEGLDESAVLMG
jgi:hypothetical protein